MSLVKDWYTGIEKVEIIGPLLPAPDDLQFVEARVWAQSRADGKGFHDWDYDNPGCFFLRLEGGWVLVPESRWPEIIALGKCIFRL